MPFALVLADAAEGRVYIGREAARELCERAGLPVLVGENYESLADAVVTDTDADPDPHHGSYPLAGATRERFPDLAAAAEAPARQADLRG